MINDMDVVCPNSRKVASANDMNSSKRRKTENVSCSSCHNPSEEEKGCTWKGKVLEVEDHMKECNASSGCDFKQSRSNLRKNIYDDDVENVMMQMERDIELQFRIREAKIKEKYERQLNLMRIDMEKERSHRRLLNLCRSWIKNRPKSMLNFVVYLIFNESKTGRKTNKIVSSLLCGIPGPKRTAWEGCMFPLKLSYNNAESLVGDIPEELSKCIGVKTVETCNSIQKTLLAFQNSLQSDVQNKDEILQLYVKDALTEKAVEHKLVGKDEIIFAIDIILISDKMSVM